MIEIPGRGQDHLIPRPGQRGNGRAKRLIAALGDGHLRGQNGCGKSSVLKAIAGLWPYGEGRIALGDDGGAGGGEGAPVGA